MTYSVDLGTTIENSIIVTQTPPKAQLAKPLSSLIQHVHDPNMRKLMSEGKMFLQNARGFVGVVYRVCNMWFNIIPVLETPIKYLEIGTFYGANAISVAKSYASHKDSEIHCCDPWVDYDEYDEYKTLQPSIYSAFIKNIESIRHDKSRFRIHRDYSYNVLPKFENDTFDMIYIDGNHTSQYVLEDAVLSFRKLKTNGYMIFDDYSWSDINIGIHSFIDSYKDSISILACTNCQLYIQKIPMSTNTNL
jgi:hypothetical protein